MLIHSPASYCDTGFVFLSSGAGLLFVFLINRLFVKPLFWSPSPLASVQLLDQWRLKTSLSTIQVTIRHHIKISPRTYRELLYNTGNKYFPLELATMSKPVNFCAKPKACRELYCFLLFEKYLE